jgi:hypothetical protein
MSSIRQWSLQMYKVKTVERFYISSTAVRIFGEAEHWSWDNRRFASCCGIVGSNKSIRGISECLVQ